MATPLAAELHRLLDADPDRVRRAERLEFDRRAEPFADSLVLFGAGRLGRRIARYLQERGIRPLAFADNNTSAWGTTIDGIPVLSPADAARQYADRAAFVVTIRHPGFCFDEVRRPLAALGCTRVIPYFVLYWKYAETFLPHFFLDLPHRTLEKAADAARGYEVWADDASRREYVGQLRLRLDADYSGLVEPDPNQYFPTGLFTLDEKDAFVDCGAFDGDSVREFLARRDDFRNITAIEPDPINVRRLQDYVSTLPVGVRARIDVLNLAVGARPETLVFQASGSVESAVSAVGNHRVECARLDDLCRDACPTLIKMDIEGSEPAALDGARATIARCRPILAVCVYHHPYHLWQIPLWIHEVMPDYRLFLRPHDYEGWDLVCYALPAERLR